MAAEVVFPGTIKIGSQLVSTANTNRDGATGTVVTIFTAGANGSEVYWVSVKARGATTGGMIRLFLHDGTSYKGLLREIPVEAVPSPSATVQTFAAIVPLVMMAEGKPGLPLLLPNGWSLRASTHNGEQFDVIAQGADY